MTQSEKNSKRWMIKVSLIIALMILSMLMLEKPESTKERERARDYLAEKVPDDILNISFRKSVSSNSSFFPVASTNVEKNRE